jgi:hypothetical protein
MSPVGKWHCNGTGRSQPITPLQHSQPYATPREMIWLKLSLRCLHANAASRGDMMGRLLTLPLQTASQSPVLAFAILLAVSGGCRVATAQTFTEYPIPTANSRPEASPGYEVVRLVGLLI